MAGLKIYCSRNYVEIIFFHRQYCMAVFLIFPLQTSHYYLCPSDFRSGIDYFLKIGILKLYSYSEFDAIEPNLSQYQEDHGCQVVDELVFWYGIVALPGHWKVPRMSVRGAPFNIILDNMMDAVGSSDKIISIYGSNIKNRKIPKTRP